MDERSEWPGALLIVLFVALSLIAAFTGPKIQCNQAAEKYPDQAIEWRGGDCMIQTPSGEWVLFSDEVLVVVRLWGMGAE